MEPWTSFVNILVALGLALVIGLEREYYSKAAGMRTYTLVGMGSALFTVVSKYGFLDMAAGDGSRVAAQVVSGIGFLGAGLIFVRRDLVRGLTTAAGIWFVAAVGMAAGAGLLLLAAVSTALYLLLMFGTRPLSARLPHAPSTETDFRIRYVDGRGVLRDVMETLSSAGLKVLDLRVVGTVDSEEGRLQDVVIEAEGSAPALTQVLDELGALHGVRSATMTSDR